MLEDVPNYFLIFSSTSRYAVYIIIQITKTSLQNKYMHSNYIVHYTTLPQTFLATKLGLQSSRGSYCCIIIKYKFEISMVTPLMKIKFFNYN